MFKVRRQRGQGLVEFALILPALLMIVLSIIEGALLFQAYLAVQHAAREAARYAVTYQPPITYGKEQGEDIQKGLDPGPPQFAPPLWSHTETEDEWLVRRAGYIKQRALDQALGIRLVYPVIDAAEDTAYYGAMSQQPGFFGVRIWGFYDPDLAEQLDHPGAQGLPIKVRVEYRWEALDPLIGAIVPNGVMLTGEAIMINEGIQVGMGAVAPPTFAPPPTFAGPTVPPTQDPVSTATPTPTPTYTPTPLAPTPTPTPTGAYAVLLDTGGREKTGPWNVDELPNGVVELRQHPDPGPYRVYWTDNCGLRTYLGLSLTTSGGIARDALPDPAGLLANGYLSPACGGLVEGQVYQGRLSTCNPLVVANCDLAGNDTAQLTVDVLYPVKQPDLIVTRFIPPPQIVIGQPITIGVEIKNVGDDTVTGTFDIDIYVDPPERVLSGLPGMGAASGQSPKQWSVSNLAVNATEMLYFVIMLPTDGEHVVKAQVDTSDWVEEKNDENNVAGTTIVAQCSEQCDDFDAGSLDAMWTLSPIGSAGGSAGASVNAGQLRIEGSGAPLWDGADGRFYLLNQGTYEGDFVMTVKVTRSPDGSEDARAGLMVREHTVSLPATSPGARYVAVAVVNVGGVPHFQFFARGTAHATPQDLCGQDPTAGGDVWVRIVREGGIFKFYVSMDGTWPDGDPPLGCMTVDMGSFSTSSLPGILMAPR